MYVKYVLDTAAQSMSGFGDIIESFNMEVWKDTHIPLPPLSTQSRIVEFLDDRVGKIDSLIAEKSNFVDLLKEKRKVLISETVTMGIPSKRDNREYKDSGITWIGNIPKEWVVKKIKQVANVKSSKRVFEDDYREDGVPFYRSKEIVNLSKNNPIKTEIFISHQLFNDMRSKYGVVQSGDILLTSIGTIGQTWISDGREFWYKDGNITQIVSNSKFSSKFLNYCFGSELIRIQYDLLSDGSTLNALTIEKIKEIIFTFPTLAEQVEIASYLDVETSRIDSLISETSKSIELLKEYKKVLISEVVTGKIEV